MRAALAIVFALGLALPAFAGATRRADAGSATRQGERRVRLLGTPSALASVRLEDVALAAAESGEETAADAGEDAADAGMRPPFTRTDGGTALAARADGGTDRAQSRDAEIFGAASSEATGSSDSDRAREDALFSGSADAGAAGGTASAERPSEDALFGGSGDAPAAAKATPAGARGQSAQVSGEDATLFSGPAKDAFDTGAVKDNPLTVGGQFYLRAYGETQRGVDLGDTHLSLPTLVDAYLDARPNDRLRAYVLGRLSYDPNEVSGSGTSGNDPSVALDQAWLSFDIDQKVFVTAGRQHVKWGVGHFWNPTDFLASQRRDPLAVFDARLGVSMVKVQVPWEKQGFDFYGIALFEQTQRLGASSSGSTPDLNGEGSASTSSGGRLGDVGGAFRAEGAIADVAFGVDAVFQRGHKARLGADVSAPVGPFDVYGEVALHPGSDLSLWTALPGADLSTEPLAVRSYQPGGLSAATTLGVAYNFAYRENDSATLSAEYFYNSIGYSDPRIYPALIAHGAFDPFYTGRHYGALSLIAVGPFDFDKATFVLTELGNLSDRSFLTRVDLIVRVLTYLQVETFAAVHYGTLGGELRLGIDLPAQTLGAQTIPAIHVGAPVFDLGFGLRMSL